MRRILIAAVALVFLGATPAGAAPGAAYPQPATCVDTAGVLGAGACSLITAVLRQDERRTSDQIAVAVVPTTGSASIEDWSTGLFNAWGVGRAGKDNGVLLVLAMDDRALRIATGDGLRDRLPDGRASEIVGGTIMPLLREGRASDAVLLGLDAIRTALGHDISTSALAGPGTRVRTVHADEPEPEGSGAGPAWLGLVLLIGLGIAARVVSYLRPGGGGGDGSSSYRRRRPFSSSPHRSSSRSSSSRRSPFGGGRSSGGGASGRW